MPILQDAITQARTGILVPGNLDRFHRNLIHNPDGSFSTERSMSFGEGGRTILVPTIDPNGIRLTNQQAIDLYHRTGQHLGIFRDEASADAYARTTHGQLENYYYPLAQIRAAPGATIGHWAGGTFLPPGIPTPAQEALK